MPRLNTRRRRQIWQNRLQLRVVQILTWADAHHARTGRWPKQHTGSVYENLNVTWLGVDASLRKGLRGLPGGSSLARLLAERRGVRNGQALPPFSIPKILARADAHQARTGAWPSHKSGPVVDAAGETWTAVEVALAQGRRGLRGGSSLARVLAKHRGVRNEKDLPNLSVKKILAWADAHHARTGAWPFVKAVPVMGSKGETWSGINTALSRGRRGLSAQLSLSRLLAEFRGVPHPKDRPPLTVGKILSWADAFHARTGQWPKATSGTIPEALGNTWKTVAKALYRGKRGLPSGMTLANLLTAKRGVRNKGDLPHLKVKQVLRWARAHYQRTGCWPTSRSGPVADTPGETWCAIDQALIKGVRGFPGGSSLTKLLITFGLLQTRSTAQ